MSKIYWITGIAMAALAANQVFQGNAKTGSAVAQDHVIDLVNKVPVKMDGDKPQEALVTVPPASNKTARTTYKRAEAGTIDYEAQLGSRYGGVVSPDSIRTAESIADLFPGLADLNGTIVKVDGQDYKLQYLDGNVVLSRLTDPSQTGSGMGSNVFNTGKGLKAENRPSDSQKILWDGTCKKQTVQTQSGANHSPQSTHPELATASNQKIVSADETKIKEVKTVKVASQTADVVSNQFAQYENQTLVQGFHFSLMGADNNLLVERFIPCEKDDPFCCKAYVYEYRYTDLLPIEAWESAKKVWVRGITVINGVVRESSPIEAPLFSRPTNLSVQN